MGINKLVCSDDDLANKLELTHWARDFSWDKVCLISQYLDAYSVTCGTVIFDEDTEDSTMSIVIKGKVDILKQESGSRTNLIASIYHSQSFGEMSLIDGEARSAKAVAATDVELLSLSKDNLLKLRDRDPELAFDLLMMISQTISQRLRRTSGNLVAQINKNI